MIAAKTGEGSRTDDGMPCPELEGQPLNPSVEAEEEDDDIEGSWLQDLEREDGDELTEMEIPLFIDITGTTNVASVATNDDDGSNEYQSHRQQQHRSRYISLRDHLISDDADTAISSVTGTRHTRDSLFDDDMVLEDTKERYRRQISARVHQDESLHSRRYRNQNYNSNTNNVVTNSSHSISITGYRSILLGSPNTPSSIKSFVKADLSIHTNIDSTTPRKDTIDNSNNSSSRNSTRNYNNAMILRNCALATLPKTELVVETEEEEHTDEFAIHERNLQVVEVSLKDNGDDRKLPL